MRQLPLALLALGCAVPVLVSTGVADGAKVPSIKTYKATLDIAGGYDVTVEHNDLATCAPGQAFRITYRVDFEMGKPKPLTVQIIGGLATSSFAKSGKRGAVHSGTVDNYKESNYCAPERPQKIVRRVRHPGGNALSVARDGTGRHERGRPHAWATSTSPCFA